MSACLPACVRTCVRALRHESISPNGNFPSLNQIFILPIIRIIRYIYIETDKNIIQSMLQFNLESRQIYRYARIEKLILSQFRKKGKQEGDFYPFL